VIQPIQQGADLAPPTAPGLASFRLLTPAEVVAAVRLGARRPDQVVRRLQAEGLRVLLLGGRLRVRPQDLEDFLARKAQAEDAATEARR